MAETDEKQKTSVVASSAAPAKDPRPYASIPGLDISPWRRRALLTALFSGLFLSFMDTTIVAVALPTIANEFHDFDHSAWVLSAYLLTYMAFSLIVSRLSDIVGRKVVEIASFAVFMAFSLGCALSQTETQLIIFRALQGVGGSGLYSMTIVIAISSVAPKQRGRISSMIGITVAISGVLGPVLGGAITQGHNSHTWRWIFYLNLPIGGLALSVFAITYPRDKTQAPLNIKTLSSIDFVGSILLLAGSVLLVFALQEAGAYIQPWNSATVIACLVVSAVAFVAFVAWQSFLARRPHWIVKQTFPIRILTQRVVAAISTVTLLSGSTYYVAIVYLPERFQIVDGDSALMSGVKMIPMLLCSAIGATVAGQINARKTLTTYTFMLATSFQMLGYGLLSSYGDSVSSPKSIYGYQIFLGFGFGSVIATATIATQINVEPKWLAASQGALTQFRSLGGSLGLAAGVIITNHKVKISSALQAALTPAEKSALYKSPLIIASLDRKQQELVAQVYSSAFTEQMRVACYLAAAAFVASCLTWQRNPPLAPAKQRQPPGPPAGPPAGLQTAPGTPQTDAESPNTEMSDVLAKEVGEGNNSEEEHFGSSHDHKV